MSCIYNEKVKRSVAPLVCLLVIFGLSLIMVSYFGTKIGLTEEMKTAMDLVLTMVFLLAGYAAVTKAREVYRYSIIADDLIIHRISGDKNHLVRRVKLSEISSLHYSRSKKNLLGAVKRNYSRNLVKLGCCCEYQDEGNAKSFYFSPSQSMLNKINHSLRTS
ncbi:MAG TPA: hypothetical protein DHM90_06760 [Clostridiaceae bacterium]|nr:hypothetical protein [Clostridiaceae bacterium]